MAIWGKLILVSIKDDTLSKQALCIEWREAETLWENSKNPSWFSSSSIKLLIREMLFYDAFYKFYTNFFTYDINLSKTCHSPHFISNIYTYSPQKLGVN